MQEEDIENKKNFIFNEFIDNGIVICANNEHFKKVQFPISITEEIMIYGNDEHPSKNSS